MIGSGGEEHRQVMGSGGRKAKAGDGQAMASRGRGAETGNCQWGERGTGTSWAEGKEEQRQVIANGERGAQTGDGQWREKKGQERGSGQKQVMGSGWERSTDR